MFIQLLKLALLTLLCLASRVHAASPDEDPANGHSQLLAFTQHAQQAGALYSGTLRATDDYGYTTDRDFRLRVSGSRAQGDRKVVLNRFEPICFELADAARLPVDAWCDQLTLTYRGERVEIAFSSLDANRRYRFELVGASGEYVAIRPAEAAPELGLIARGSNGSIEYRWQLRSHDADYQQSGVLSAEHLRGADVSELEASLIALGEVLSTFNRYEFQFADLPRGHPAHQPTPYSAWAEQPLDGGCIFTVCFGGGGGGGGSQPDPCSPTSINYPAQCYHDLMIARWPLSLRPKLQKIDDYTVRPVYFVKNIGHLDFSLITNEPIARRFVFLSLIKVGSGEPLVPSTYVPGPNESDECFHIEDAEFFNPAGLFMYSVDVTAGGSVPNGLPYLRCDYREDGRYRLYLHVDPAAAFDTPGYTGNNEAKSTGWVRLR